MGYLGGDCGNAPAREPAADARKRPFAAHWHASLRGGSLLPKKPRKKAKIDREKLLYAF